MILNRDNRRSNTHSNFISEKKRLHFATKILQTFARCILARKILMMKANATYRRIWDDDYQTYYYANITNGLTSWEKPSVFLNTEEPPVYVDPQGHNDRRSPRFNRIKSS
jgi:hypothetical protein